MDNFMLIYRILRYLEYAMKLEEIDLNRLSASALSLTKR